MLASADDWFQFAKFLGEAALWIIGLYFAISVYRAPKIGADFVARRLSQRRLAKEKSLEQDSDEAGPPPGP